MILIGVRASFAGIERSLERRKTMKTFRRLGLAVGLALILSACGGGGGGGGGPTTGTPTCVWDSSNWDGCNWSS